MTNTGDGSDDDNARDDWADGGDEYIDANGVLRNAAEEVRLLRAGVQRQQQELHALRSAHQQRAAQQLGRAPSYNQKEPNLSNGTTAASSGPWTQGKAAEKNFAKQQPQQNDSNPLQTGLQAWHSRLMALQEESQTLAGKAAATVFAGQEETRALHGGLVACEMELRAWERSAGLEP